MEKKYPILSKLCTLYDIDIKKVLEEERSKCKEIELQLEIINKKKFSVDKLKNIAAILRLVYEKDKKFEKVLKRISMLKSTEYLDLMRKIMEIIQETNDPQKLIYLEFFFENIENLFRKIN